MTWQDELRKLDEDLASGRIAADEYRVRRDQVLSSAVAPGGAPTPTPESAPASAAESTQMIPPVTAGPPPMQQPQSGGDDSAEKTQIVSGNNMGQGERTQAIQQPDSGGWRAARPNGDSDRTQVVPGVAQQPVHGGGMAPPPPPNYQQQQNQAPLWNTGPQQAGPSPWDGPSFPPLAHGAEDWVKQGPEESSSGRKILIIVGIVVLVAALGVGGYFAFFNKSDNTAGGNPPPSTTQQTTPPPTTPTRPKDDLEIAPLQGSTERADVTDFDQVVENKFLTDGENKDYQTAGADKCRMVEATLPGDVHVFILTVEGSDAKKAKTARDALAKLQGKYGMSKYAGSAPSGVKVNQIDKKGSNPATIRGHYTHKGTIVRVQVTGPTLAAASSGFDQVISAQLGALAADV